MAQMLVRDIEDDVMERMRAKAKASGTSLEEFARRTFRNAVQPTKDEVWAEIDQIRAQTPRQLEDSTFLIREDRDNDEPYR